MTPPRRHDKECEAIVFGVVSDKGLQAGLDMSKHCACPERALSALQANTRTRDLCECEACREASAALAPEGRGAPKEVG